MKQDITLSERITYHDKKKDKSDFSLGYVSAVDDLSIAVKIGKTYREKKMLDDPKYRAFRKGHMAFLRDSDLLK